jgi:hypothetical protein
MPTAVSLPETVPLTNEHHNSIQELALRLNVSEDMVSRTFKNESGVIFYGEGPRRMMRIPESVVQRVLLRKSKK